MNALIHTIERTGSTLRLPASTGRVLEYVAFTLVLVGGFAAASGLAFLQSGLGVAESSRIIAVLAATLGWVYLGLAIDAERSSDALPDIISFVLVMTFALLSLSGNAGFIAAAFAVHLARAIMRLADGPESTEASYGLLAWIGFTFGSVLVSITAIT